MQTALTSTAEVPVVRADTDPYRLVGINVHGRAPGSGTEPCLFSVNLAAAPTDYCTPCILTSC